MTSEWNRVLFFFFLFCWRFLRIKEEGMKRSRFTRHRLQRCTLKCTPSHKRANLLYLRSYPRQNFLFVSCFPNNTSLILFTCCSKCKRKTEKLTSIFWHSLQRISIEIKKGGLSIVSGGSFPPLTTVWEMTFSIFGCLTADGIFSSSVDDWQIFRPSWLTPRCVFKCDVTAAVTLFNEKTIWHLQREK